MTRIRYSGRIMTMNIEKEKSRAVRNEMLSNYILNTLIKYRIDYLFVFGHHLLSGELLNVYKNRIIVFHPSLLPHHKGFNGIDQAIDNGDFVIGYGKGYHAICRT